MLDAADTDPGLFGNRDISILALGLPSNAHAAHSSESSRLKRRLVCSSRGMGLWGALLGTLGACAGTPKSPPEFPRDLARDVQRRLAAYVTADVDGDGQPERLAAERMGPGFVVAVYFLDDGIKWRRGCQSPVVRGPDFEFLRPFRLGADLGLMLLVSESDPEVQRQGILVVSRSNPCASLFLEQVPLVVPGTEVVAPGEIPAGVAIDEARDGFQVIDRARYLRVAGSGDDVWVLRSVRQRRFTGSEGMLRVQERVWNLLRQRALVVSRRVAQGLPREKIVGLDDQDQTALALRRGEGAVLEVTAREPVVMLEIHHGCTPGDHEPLHLMAEGRHYVTGARPDVQSWVLGTGRGHASAAYRYDLLVLRKSTVSLSLRVGPEATRRCLRQLKGFGFVAVGDAFRRSPLGPSLGGSEEILVGDPERSLDFGPGQG